MRLPLYLLLPDDGWTKPKHVWEYEYIVWNNDIYVCECVCIYIYMCVCVRARARAHVCVCMYVCIEYKFFMAQQPNSRLGSFNFKVSRSHAIRHIHTNTHAVERTWTSDQTLNRGRYLNSKCDTRTSIPSSVYEPVSQQPATDLRLWPHGHQDRRKYQ